MCLGSCSDGAPLCWQNKMRIVKCDVFYMLCAGIYTCVHGTKWTFFFIYMKKSTGGRLWISVCRRENTVSVHIRVVSPASSDSSAELLSVVCQAAPEIWHSHFLSIQRGFLFLFLLTLCSWQNKIDWRNLYVF